MSRATDYLEQLGSDRRIVEPSVVDAIIGLGMLLDERLRQTADVLIRVQMTLEDLLAEAKHIRAALTPHEPEDQEPDIDDEPPPDYGPPGSGAVIVEYD